MAPDGLSYETFICCLISEFKCVGETLCVLSFCDFIFDIIGMFELDGVGMGDGDRPCLLC